MVAAFKNTPGGPPVADGLGKKQTRRRAEGSKKETMKILKKAVSFFIINLI